MPCRLLAEEIELVRKDLQTKIINFNIDSNYLKIQSASVVETQSECKDIAKEKEECLIKVGHKRYIVK